MRNEYGVKLDSNGYAPSIVLKYVEDACFRCGRMGDLARHEIFNGSNRRKSKALGLWVTLCPQCHDILHSDKNARRQLKQIGQRHAMAAYDWSIDDFIERFWKNYDE